MLKLGICSAAQDTPAARRWRRGLTAASLLPTDVPASAADTERFERVMSQTRMSNGVARTTARHRFAAVDANIELVLRKVYPPGFRLQVHDFAVSSGITALEWYESLMRIYPALTFAASDWVLYLVEALREDRGDAFIVEPSGLPVQYVRPPFVVSLTEMQNPVYLINRALQRRALWEWSNVLSASFHLPEEWNGLNGGADAVSMPPFVLRRLPLIHPEVMRARSEQFRICQHSVFTPLSAPVQVIRTMNILNRAYFNEQQLRSAALAVGQSLEEGGVWIVGRTVSDRPLEHELSVLRKNAGVLEPLLRIGKGSEMEAVLAGHRKP